MCYTILYAIYNNYNYFKTIYLYINDPCLSTVVISTNFV